MEEIAHKYKLHKNKTRTLIQELKHLETGKQESESS